MRTLFLSQFLRMAPVLPVLAAAKVLAGCGQEGPMTGDAGIPPLGPPSDGGETDASPKKKFGDCFGRFEVEIIRDGGGSSRFVPRRVVDEIYPTPQSGIFEFEFNLMWVGPPDPPSPPTNAITLRLKGDSMSKFYAPYSTAYPMHAARLGATYNVKVTADLDLCDIPSLQFFGTALTVDGNFPDQAEMAVFVYPGGISDPAQEDGYILNVPNLEGGTAQVSFTEDDIDSGRDDAICDNNSSINCEFISEAEGVDLGQPPPPTRVAVRVRR